MMDTFAIRNATVADVPQLAELTANYVGLNYPWRLLLGSGSHAHDTLAMVAGVGAEVHAMIAAGPPTADVAWERSPGAVQVSNAPWWKIRVLATDSQHRGTGMARALLAETVRRLPRTHVGLYGNVELHRSDAITWYRRQGFYISPTAGLTSTENPGEIMTIGIMPTPGEVVFRGYRTTLRDHLAGHGNPRWESRIARAEFTRTVRLYGQGNKPSADLGYRLFARRIGMLTNAASCVHGGMGPRPMYVFGWDPQLARVCAVCSTEQMQRIRQYDAETHCDGCHHDHHDTRVSWAADDDSLLIAVSGLCPGCRAGDQARAVNP